ncbi:GNAT family N-acetyltransferase [Streptococcus cuniculi]|uniref:GNAT family N-acetyltransferase n=1 Tax=Streptococcus cuniculi TaxID=1432788 RepID=A0A1Q8E9L8_9STRE|nr:GNAT family N-acetyltransferase [Streptococcus cuniculi]OLF48489.1 GNAT family N-acetyltransferase [Streptococcus cuniculi]
MISIRTAEVSDAAALRAIYEPYVVKTAITFDFDVPSEADFAQKIASVQERHPFLVAESEGKVIGYAYASTYYDKSAYDWTAELTIYMDENKRGLRLGSVLYDMLEEELIKRNFKNFVACISLPNDASIAFHEKRGYEQVAHFKKVGYKFDKWHDIVWLQKSLVEE